MTDERLSKITSEKLATDLIEFKRIILPQRIDHEAYANLTALLIYAMREMPGQFIELYCNGDGGNTDESRAIVGLIQEHERCDGILLGVAHSTCSVIWAACRRRWVYPTAQIAVHRSCFYYNGETFLTAKGHEIMARNARLADDFSVQIYAAASDRDMDWWREKEYDGAETVRLDASELIAIGMARPIVELGAPEVSISENEKSP